MKASVVSVPVSSVVITVGLLLDLDRSSRNPQQ
jgi:hypothetical protein